MCNRNNSKMRSVSTEVYRKLLNQTYEGIIRKLESATALLEIDEYLSAGLYTYASEELGKILLLKQSARLDGEIQIEYIDKFIRHKSKFELAFDYLQQNRHGHCIILNSGGYDPNGYSWGGFTIGLLADFEARLSIFYSDLKEGEAEVKEIPPVDGSVLHKATFLPFFGILLMYGY
jgi:hypothetical protein